MSLGSIPRQRKVSDAQFVGDLMGLLKRHRIESADAGGYGQFELNLASKDTFRSQLFTLCTAISHMADEDLSGEELLALIDRAMGASGRPYEDGDGGMPESMRMAFLSGYDAWSTRAMNDPDVWPPVRQPTPANEPIPFPQPTEALPEPEHGLRVPGLPTVQEALLMAKKQAPFELPVRVTPLPEAQATAPISARGGSNPAANTAAPPAPSANVDNLTISELTQLLEDIERRMSRIKPHFHELTSLMQTPAERHERATRPHGLDDADTTRQAMTAAAIGPALVDSRLDVPLSPLDAALTITENVEDDPFVARHAYLNPKGRWKAPMTPPASVFVAEPTPTPPPAVVPAPKVLEARLVTEAAPVEASDTKIFPRSRSAAAAQYKNIEAAIAVQPDSYRILVHIAIGVLAAVILVAIPLAGMMVYRSWHPVYQIHGLQVAQPAADPTAASPNASSPATAPNSVSGVTPAAGASAPKASSGVRNRATKHKPPPPVAVWPPPPPPK